MLRALLVLTLPPYAVFCSCGNLLLGLLGGLSQILFTLLDRLRLMSFGSADRQPLGPGLLSSEPRHADSPPEPAASRALGASRRSRIFVKTLDTTIAVEVDPETTVADLRRRLVQSELRSYTVGRKVRFIYLGFLLSDDTVLVNRVPQDGVIHCVISEHNGLEGYENNPEGRTVPLDLEALMDEDRRLAEILERGGEIDIDDAGNVDISGYRSTSNMSGTMPRRSGERGRRRNGGGPGGALDSDGTISEGSGGSIYGFLLSFAFGFIFGFFSLLFVNRLDRRQSVGLMLGISLNFVLSAVGQASAETRHANRAGSLRGSAAEITVLDRFGNERIFRETDFLDSSAQISH